ncbi:bifunctional 4-hydroxy-2-oxoglutarate aldolase/2-dehydro-3-deoxy-phosphogluconate aldolase [Pseudarthrobacter oxydans]|uniref:bifunctional 4-hydroxy-2-oxoglutarate aldolase/2-dehydro-3-deoxy-phosphogluconate aldolase n=1 Tax=Pseudarthrobacter oxydans TaxID=1671 RepID=UPI0034193458
MSTNTRAGLSTHLQDVPVVAVLRAQDAAEYLPIINALLDGGVRSIELTLSTAGVFEHLTEIIGAVGGRGEIGVGTVTTLAETEQALDAGAAFIVTPISDQAIVKACAEHGVPVFPGGLTPTELYSSWTAGATAVKVFPASTVGSDYLKQLRGPFPDLLAIPSGGVDSVVAAEWIAAGACAVSVGGPLIGDAFRGGNLNLLTERARNLVASVQAAQAGVHS